MIGLKPLAEVGLAFTSGEKSVGFGTMCDAIWTRCFLDRRSIVFAHSKEIPIFLVAPFCLQLRRPIEEQNSLDQQASYKDRTAKLRPEAVVSQLSGDDSLCCFH